MKKGIRRCVTCRILNDRQQMHRLNRETTGVEALPAGRSIYLCQQSTCIQSALKNRRWLKQNPDLTLVEWEQICQNLLTLPPLESVASVNFKND